MRLFSKIGAVVAGVVVLLAACAMPAMAAAPQQTCALQVGAAQGTGYFGVYGDDIELVPASMSCIEHPGDKFHFQAYVSDVTSQGVPVGMVWKDFRDFEDIQLEDTNTVQPFSFGLGQDDAVILGDGSVIFPQPPYLIRCEYKPNYDGAADASGNPIAGSSTSPSSLSETETVHCIKNATRVSIATSGAVKHAGTTLKFQVLPNSGEGTVTVSIVKKGAKTGLKYNLVTNENGLATAKLKLGSKAGTYTVSARFLGNAYGNTSKTTSKNLVAK